MKKYYFLLFLFLLGSFWSGIHPFRFGVWLAEIVTTFIGLIILITTFEKFRFTLFSYIVILISCYFIFIGAHYSFARVPLFNWVRDYFGHERNNFDKIGHFVQGILPVIIGREIFIRQRLIRGYKWVSFLSFCICMATTSVYELVEYFAAMTSKIPPVDFLGTQGYFWDTQTDMLYAALGGLFTLIFLKKTHDRLMEKEFPGTFQQFRSFVLEPNPSAG